MKKESQEEGVMKERMRWRRRRGCAGGGEGQMTREDKGLMKCGVVVAAGESSWTRARATQPGTLRRRAGRGKGGRGTGGRGKREGWCGQGGGGGDCWQNNLIIR